MPDWWAGLASKRETLWVAIGALFVIIGAIAAIRRYLNSRPSAEELERRRRADIHRGGKMGDGEILDVDGASASIVYSYSVAGVVYTSTQDASALRALLPRDVMTMVGPVSIKFDPRNPANSIILCEDWSGLRNRV